MKRRDKIGLKGKIIDSDIFMNTLRSLFGKNNTPKYCTAFV